RNRGHCRGRTHRLPRRVPAVNTIRSRDVVSKNFSVKMENISCHRIESDVMSIDFALNRSRLDGTFEISGDAVAVLGDLYMLNLNLSVPSVGGVNRPIALHVVRWLVGECRSGEGE